jgi:protein-S-isoprenylcysteine O-methyltransferase Ste14
MEVPSLIIPISILWFLSEITLSVVKRAGKESAKSDKSSMKVLWVTIYSCLVIGILLGVNGIGLIPRWLPVLSYAGITLVILGLVIRWSAVLTLKRYFTVDVAIARDHKIVDKGLYGVIRHPAYSGALLSFLGLAIYFSNIITFLIIMAPITGAFMYRIRVEEQALRAAFGDEYAAYCVRTKRLIPGVY